jgi:hypothetical protein
MLESCPLFVIGKSDPLDKLRSCSPPGSKSAAPEIDDTRHQRLCPAALNKTARRRPPVDLPLHHLTVPVTFLDKSTSIARAEGNNAAWICKCKEELRLTGRCYYSFGDTCYTVCPSCPRRYRVTGARTSKTGGMQANGVIEIV